MQVAKEEVRDKFTAAAGALFARQGYAATTMADVARAAGFATGNLYRYFATKEDLFAAVVPPEFPRQLLRLTRARISALEAQRDIGRLPADSRYHVLAGELLDFSFSNRDRVVILLARGEGTAVASFATTFRDHLVQWALDYVKRAWPKLRPTTTLRFALDHIYESFLRGIASALTSFPSEPIARAAIADLTTFHQAGLKRLFEIHGGDT